MEREAIIPDGLDSCKSTCHQPVGEGREEVLSLCPMPVHRAEPAGHPCTDQPPHRGADKWHSPANDLAAAVRMWVVQCGWLAHSCWGWLSLLQPQTASLVLLCFHGYFPKSS